MCKELGAGARCRLRKAAAKQITALRYICEAVGVKRATTELRADLDTPALAEALKTTERKLQIAEQRVATLEGSLSRQQNLRMHGELSRAIDIPAKETLPTTSTRKSLCSTVVPSARQR